jgi:hypothetical protein
MENVPRFRKVQQHQELKGESKMSYFEYRSGELLMDMRLEGSRNLSNGRTQLRQAGLAKKPRLVHQRRRLENQVSRLTVTLTQALERIGKLKSSPLSG